MNEKFLKPYEAKDTEDRIYKTWEKSGYFNPDKCIEDGVCQTDAESFSIVLPPPNVTGTLHNGHALMLAIEDTMVRYNRMKGKKTLWIPGTDHAAIATESVVVKKLAKEKTNKHEIGREKFLELVSAHAKESQETIKNQLRKMGASLDWSREAFTLDEIRQKAVFTAFEKMYNDGLIYRGDRIVNWDPKGQTTVSDDEVEHEARKGKLYYFKYSNDFPITIATTRPETKLGDTGVAVHPEDKRYKEFIGKTYEVDFVGVPLTIKVIADEEIDPEFGTGAVGITPSHSQTDWALAEKHDLPKKQIINEYGKITVSHPDYENKKVAEVREIVIEKLKAAGLFEKEVEIDQNVSISQRSKAIIEPLPKLQWWIDVNKEVPGEGKSLKDMMMEAVSKDGVEILPQRFEKVYTNWIENLRDWNISRQIWYGHRVPVWYDLSKEENKNAILFIDNKFLDRYFNYTELGKLIRINKDSGEIKSTCIECLRVGNGTTLSFSSVSFLLKNKKIRLEDLKKNIIGKDFSKAKPEISFKEPQGSYFIQDEDTLDTWFSSGLWTFSTLGWPEKTEDLKTYHPTSVLETGSDILFFWVARMILMSKYLLKEIPFKTVYMHGMVLDKNGKKMSKSNPETAIDPITIVEEYGADALRMAMIVGVGPGSPNSLSAEKIKAYKKFGNKIWNATRFVLENTEGFDDTNTPELEEKHKKFILMWRDLVKEITKEMEEYKFYLVAEKLYHFFWHTFADIVIEECKKDLNDSAKYTIMRLLKEQLKALHPFMPFITEEIWGLIHGSKEHKLLIINEWPK